MSVYLVCSPPLKTNLLNCQKYIKLRNSPHLSISNVVFRVNASHCQHRLVLSGKHGHDCNEQIRLFGTCTIKFDNKKLSFCVDTDPFLCLVGRRIQSPLYVPRRCWTLVGWVLILFGIVMLLALQSIVCLVCLLSAKNFRVISFRDFNADEARKCMRLHPTYSF